MVSGGALPAPVHEMWPTSPHVEQHNFALACPKYIGSKFQAV